MNGSPTETQTSIGYLSTMSMGGGFISTRFFFGLSGFLPERAAVLGLGGIGSAAGFSSISSVEKLKTKLYRICSVTVSSWYHNENDRHE